MRSISAVLPLTWERNSNYKTGEFCKTRWKLETEVREGLAECAELVTLVAGIGRWRRGRVDRTVRQLLDNHPAHWALNAPGYKVYLPKAVHSTARAWLRLLRSLRMLLARIGMLRQAWGNMMARSVPQSVSREIPKHSKAVPLSLKALLGGSLGP